MVGPGGVSAPFASNFTFARVHSFATTRGRRGSQKASFSGLQRAAQADV